MRVGKQRRLVFVAAVLLASMLLVFFGQGTAQARSFDKVVYANADPDKYYIEVDLTNKIITVYEKGEKSKKYDQIAKQFICTTGTDETPTPAGTFKLNEMRRRFGYFRKYDVYAQYWTNVSGGIYFHSVLYPTPEEGNITRSSYRALGRQASHGCIRMLVEDARWLYYNCPSGTDGILKYKEKDEALRQSLLPTMSYDNYRSYVKKHGDEYEAAKRSLPTALVTSTATFVATNGTEYTAQPGTAVSVVSSGGKSCRVRWNGVEGHIATSSLEFLPNGPKDQAASKQAIADAQRHYQVGESGAVLYKSANPTKATLGEYGEGTDVSLLPGSTVNFYKVKVDGQTGYMYKEDLVEKQGARTGSAKVYRIEDMVLDPDLEDEEIEDLAMDMPEEDEGEG